MNGEPKSYLIHFLIALAAFSLVSIFGKKEKKKKFRSIYYLGALDYIAKPSKLLISKP